MAFVSGFGVAAARLAAPDAGLLSFAEVADQAACIAEAGRSPLETAAAAAAAAPPPPPLPLIVDADTGYGSEINVRRTIQAFAREGFAGMLVEDQAWPKSCGHVGAKMVVPRDEAVRRCGMASRCEVGSGHI